MEKSAHKKNFFKIAFLGNSGVGKTSLANYLKYNGNVPNNIQTTLGVDIYVITDTLRDGTDVNYFIFDSPGQERWKSVSYSTYKQANGVLLVYSVTDRNSFDDIQRWVQDIQDHCTDIVWFLIANKTDVDKAQRVVSFEEGQQLARVYGVKFFETSIFDQRRPNHAVSIRQVMSTMGEAMVDVRRHKRENAPVDDAFALDSNRQAPPAQGRGCKC
jgi:small GTP-binding protein